MNIYEKNLKRLNAIPPISQRSREKYQPFAFWPPTGYVTMKTKDKGGREQWQAYGSIDRVNTGYFRMTNLVTKGYSGGPIIRNGSNEEIVGVVHGYNDIGFGFGTRITDYMIEIIASYR
ncbi:MAG: hypothetical protein HFJ25_03945 [Clostridia bacterium]|nr:hypothetical protein [Clostridia bacterium]